MESRIISNKIYKQRRVSNADKSYLICSRRNMKGCPKDELRWEHPHKYMSCFTYNKIEQKLYLNRHPIMRTAIDILLNCNLSFLKRHKLKKMDYDEVATHIKHITQRNET